MTTKTATKTAGKRGPEAPSPELMKTVNEIHTLTRMIYAELAVTRPWLAHTLPMQGVQPTVDPRMAWGAPPETPWPPQGTGSY